MKYFGTYNKNTELVPKSYVDSYVNNLLYSHDEFVTNVALRVAQFKTEKETLYFDWDNYNSLDDNGGNNNVGISINPLIRSTSIKFDYIYNSDVSYYPDPEFPAHPSNVINLPTNNTIYYVLEISRHLDAGRDLFVYMRTSSYLNLNSYKIRVTIPNEITIDSDTRSVFYSGKFSPFNTNAYLDLGYDNSGLDDYYTSATLHIYSDGENYFIDRFPYYIPVSDNNPIDDNN